MAGEPPCYFFSYARKDWDKYLEKFFNEIERRIVKDGGRDPEMLETGFLDRKDIKTGDDWNDRLADGLSRCLSLLSDRTVEKSFKSFLIGRTLCPMKQMELLPGRRRSYRYFGFESAIYSKKCRQ